MPLAITVSAKNIIDELYISTNNGECVDMLAPGEEVLSAYPGGRKTVMAADQVSGTIAAILSKTATNHDKKSNRS